jgi:hypothetical protein
MKAHWTADALISMIILSCRLIPDTTMVNSNSLSYSSLGTSLTQEAKPNLTADVHASSSIAALPVWSVHAVLISAQKLRDPA